MKSPIKYGLLFLLLLLIEVLIALYVNDRFVRPYLGDTLVIFLIYYFLMFWVTLIRLNVSKRWVALSVLIFAFGVEFGQAFNIIQILGLETYKGARIVLGTSFSFLDLVAYFVGFILVRLTDR